MLTRSRKTETDELVKLPYSGRLFPKPYVYVEEVLYTTPCSSSLLMEKARAFKHLILKTLDTRLGDEIPEVCDKRSHLDESRKYYLSALRVHTLAMVNAPSKNYVTKEKGILPLLLHSSLLDVLFPHVKHPLPEYDGYIPVLICTKNIELKADGVHANTMRLDKEMYKLHVFNADIHVPYAILIGRQYTHKKQVYRNALEHVAWVDLRGLTRPLIREEFTPPFPLVACKRSWQWEELEKQGIPSILDPRCTAETLNVFPTYVPLVNAILDTQRGTDLIRPHRFSFTLPKNKRVLYVDFETIPEKLMDDMSSLDCDESNRYEFIFLIGVGWTDTTGEWTYRTFVLDECTFDAEKRMLTQFHAFVETEPSVLFHWFSAELKFLHTACTNLGIPTPEYEWWDLHDYFTSVPITLKECYNFQLKSVAKAMHQHGFIPTTWDSDVQDGLTCSETAYLYYTSPFRIGMEDKFRDMVRYNEVDCKVMWDIVRFLCSRY